MSTGLSVWRSVKRVAAVAITVAVLALSAPAAAQGTSGVLADPVSSGDLNKFLDRYLDLTPEQWAQVDAFHEQYKEEFKRFRETEVEEFLKEMRSIQGSMPKKDDLKAFLDKMERMQTRIRGFDSRLFDQIQGVLTEEQAPLMPRVRRARERDTYKGEMTRGFSGGGGADLVEAYFTLKLTPEEKAAAEPIFTDYEARLTSQLKRLMEATTNSFVTMFEAIEKSGIDFEALQNPGAMAEMDPEEVQKKMAEMMEVMRTAMAEAGKKSLEISADIARMHHTTRAALAPHLSDESNRALRSEFYRRAYPRVASHDMGTERQFRAALRLRDLSADERESITAAMESFVRADEASVEAMVKMIDEHRASQTMMDWGSEQSTAHEAELNKLVTARQEAGTQASASLHAMLGPERSEKLAKVGTIEDTIEGLGEMVGSEVAGEVAGAIGSQGEPIANPEVPQMDDWNSWSGDSFLPAAISARDLARIGRLVNADDGERAILEALHTDYVNGFNELSGGAIKAVQEAQQAQWKRSDTGEQEWVPPSPEGISRTYALRKTALDAIIALDKSFFENVTAAIATDDAKLEGMKLAQLYRTARVYSGGRFWGMFGMDGTNEGQVNLLQIIDGLAIEDGSQAVVDQVFTEKADTYTKALRDTYLAQFDAQRAQEEWSAEIQARQRDDPDAAMAMGMQYMERMKEYSDKVREPAERKRTLNREILTELKTALSDDVSRKLTIAYNKAAFPSIFTDQRSAEPYLEKAGRLNDLTPEQREAIAAATEEFRTAYDDLSSRMVEVSANSINMMEMGNDPDAWKEYMKREEVMAKHRFDRDEVSAKALRRIRVALSKEQIDRLPGLATADHREEDVSYYP